MQRMSDVPVERLERTPLFAHIGLDVFGPFHTTEDRRTCNTAGTKKIWTYFCIPSFPCYSSRAIIWHGHIKLQKCSTTVLISQRRVINNFIRPWSKFCGSTQSNGERGLAKTEARTQSTEQYLEDDPPSLFSPWRGI